MKIALAQIQYEKGDIARNIELHLIWIDQAIAQGADCIFFPELSLTGYEPTLPKSLEEELEQIAKKHSMFTALVNTVGTTDEFICGSKSAVWNNEGLLLHELDADQEGLGVFDLQQ